jgi:hypothetical protein
MQAGLRKRMAAAIGTMSAVAALVVGGTPGVSQAATIPSLQAFTLSPNGKTMAAFLTDQPGTLQWVKAVTGLVGDTSLVGIDFRVQNGLLYGVGDKGGVYTITTPPTTTTVVVTKVSQLSVPLQGTNFGVDFNPAADRLRIAGDTGQNLSHNLANSQTTTQTPLTTDGASTSGVSAVAYTNNDLNGTTGTALYDINPNTDQLLVQSPPANGLLVANGSLGVDAGPNAGFDIFSDLSAGKTVSVTGFATLLSPDGSTATFNMVNLFTGQTTHIDTFPIPVSEVAVALDPNP